MVSVSLAWAVAAAKTQGPTSRACYRGRRGLNPYYSRVVAAGNNKSRGRMFAFLVVAGAVIAVVVVAVVRPDNGSHAVAPEPPPTSRPSSS